MACFKRILCLSSFLFALFGCGTQDKMREAFDLDSSAFASLLKETPALQLIDVRTEQEYFLGHIPGATLMDVNEPDFETKAKTLDKKEPVAVYCRSGRRSLDAQKRLQEMGFAKVYNLKGGILTWQGAMTR